MKAKNIKAVLAKKFKDFVSHIRDRELAERVRGNSIITGGAITSMLLGEDVNDYDIYFKTMELAYDVAKHYVEEFKKDPPPRFKAKGFHVEALPDRVKIHIKYESFEEVDPNEENPERLSETIDASKEVASASEATTKYHPIFLSVNCITLSDKVQLVTRFFGEPEEIHKNYDFVHCTCYWTSWNQELVLPPAALESMLAKDLRYVGSKYPICSLVRARKFVQRGWGITAGQILKIAWQISKLDLENIETLEEQLIGVDTLLFQQLISIMKEAMEKLNLSRIDSAFLFRLVDAIF